MADIGPTDMQTHTERGDGSTGKPSLSPTLVLGLGGTGTDALRYLKRRLVWLWHGEAISAALAAIPDGVDHQVYQEEVWRRFEMEGGPPLIQLLAIDTWPWMNRAGQVYLNRHEYAYLGGYNANRVLQNLPQFPEIESWWTWDAEHARPGQIHSGARQIRAIGRLSFYRRYREFKRQVDPRLAAMTSIQARQDVLKKGFQVAPSGSTQYVYIIGSLCGGTGAGTFLDIAAAMREHFLEGADIIGIFALPSVFIPELGSDIQRDRVQANAYAALKELSYFQYNNLQLHLPGERAVEVPPLFNRIYLIERQNLVGDGLSDKRDILQLIANQVFLESMTDVGSRVREYDVNITSERHEVEGQTLAYSFSSFANSALVMPSEQVRSYGQLKYAQSLISDGLLRKPTPAELNQLAADVTAGLGHVAALVSGSNAGGDEEEEEREEGEPASNTGQPAEGPLEQLVQELNRAAAAYGLRGAHEYAQRILARISESANASRAQVTQRDQDATSVSARLRQMETNRPWQERFLIGPLSVFAARAVRQRRQTEATLRRTAKTAQGELQRFMVLRDRWNQLEKSLGPVVGQVEERIRQLEHIRDVLILPDINRVSVATGIPDQKPYEMLTVLLGDNLVRETLWPDIVSRPIYTTQLTTDALALASNAALCHFDIVLAPVKAAATDEFPRTVVLSPTSTDALSQLVEATAQKAIRNLVQPEEYHIKHMLASRAAHIQAQMHDLFNRCQPFWRYDLDRGGLSESSLEELVLVGVHGQADHDRTWAYMLRDHPEFQLVETNDPTRVEACRIQHGLPLRYLSGLADYKLKYEDYFQRKAGPLQLSGLWEPDGHSALPDILDGSKRQAGNGPEADWSQDA